MYLYYVHTHLCTYNIYIYIHIYAHNTCMYSYTRIYIICICMRVYVYYIYTHHIYTHHIYIYVHIERGLTGPAMPNPKISLAMPTCTYIQTNKQTNTHAHMHVNIHTHKQTNIHTCIHAYNTYMHAYSKQTYMLTHTHTALGMRSEPITGTSTIIHPFVFAHLPFFSPMTFLHTHTCTCTCT